MINQSVVDRSSEFRREYDDRKSVLITDFLKADIANETLALIDKREDWDMVTLRQKRPFLVGNKEFMSLPPATKNGFLNEILMGANKESFHYLYEFVRLIGPDSKPEPEFEAIKSFIESDDFLNYFKGIIDEDIVSVDAKITKYASGYFLKQHCDVATDGEAKRAAAFVISLSKDWKPDWGGLLNIQDDDNNIIRTITPKFNSIVVFKVPQQHFVSQVANFCSETRYSITGWFWKK